MTERVRWRMTLDELCHQIGANPTTLEAWAQLGAFGPRWKEPRDRGKWRHITKEVAHRAIIMQRLLLIGMLPVAAARIAATHEVKHKKEPLQVNRGGVVITIYREDLNLP